MGGLGGVVVVVGEGKVRKGGVVVTPPTTGDKG